MSCYVEDDQKILEYVTSLTNSVMLSCTLQANWPSSNQDLIRDNSVTKYAPSTSHWDDFYELGNQLWHFTGESAK